MIDRMRLIRRSGGTAAWELRALVVAIIAVTLGVVVLVGVRVTDALQTPDQCPSGNSGSAASC